MAESYSTFLVRWYREIFLAAVLVGLGIYLFVLQDGYQSDLAMASRSYNCDTLVRLGGDKLSVRENQLTTFGMAMSNRIANEAIELAVIDAMGRDDVRKHIGFRKLMRSVDRFIGAKIRFNSADAGGGTVWVLCGEEEKILRYLLNEAKDLPAVDLYASQTERSESHKAIYAPWDMVIADSVRHYSARPTTCKEVAEVEAAWSALKFELDHLRPAQAKAIIYLLFSRGRDGQPTLSYDIGGG